jgi:putative DNA primase/helicase
MHKILGDYAAPASVESFIHKRSEKDRTRSVARLVGKRLIFAQETDDGSRLSEQAVKSFTGSDAISFRELFEEETTTIPTWHIHLAVNDRPQIRGTDIGIWRRVKLVPWTYRFTGAAQRPRAEVEDELWEERAGILNWLLFGLAQWRDNGLQEPNAVKAATNEYQQESDKLTDWIADRCVENPAAITKTNDLYVDYRDWCKQTGNLPYPQVKFGKELGARGFRSERPSHGDYRHKTVRHGIGLNANPNNWVDFEE